MVYPQSYTNIKYKIHGRFREISLWDFLMILTILLKTNLDPNKQLRKRRAARNKYLQRLVVVSFCHCFAVGEG